MQFGFTLKPDMPLARIVSLSQLAERSGFEYGWIFDSHVLWKDPYPLLTGGVGIVKILKSNRN